ncbi:expressed unknown protein (Partial), partial [Seminavis robusta]|eukprot:Sro947_g223480.1 n/a (1103) ;mRNA; f:38348-41754
MGEGRQQHVLVSASASAQDKKEKKEKKDAGFGMKRGFLLDKPKKKKTKTTVKKATAIPSSSAALLDLEEAVCTSSSSSCSLVGSSSTHDTNTTSQFLQVVASAANDDNHHNDTSTLSSTLQSTLLPVLQHDLENAESSSMELVEVDSHATRHSISVKEKVQETSPTFLEWQKELDRTLWSLRRRRQPRRQWQSVAHAFCESLDTTAFYHTVCWDILLDQPELAERRLGWALLQTCNAWDSFVSYLLLLPSHEDRRRTLGAVVILEFFASQDMTPPLHLIQAIQLLGQIVTTTTTTTTRTVLVQQCLVTIYKLVTVLASTTAVTTGTSSITQQQVWDLSAQVLVPVWDRHLAWTTPPTSLLLSNNIDNDTAGQRVAARKQCTSLVLQSWKQSFIELQQQNDIDNMNTTEVHSTWCQHLRGIPDRLGIHGTIIGSLGQTLCRDEIMTLGDVRVLILGEMTTIHKIHNDSHVILAILRSVVAWLGSSKKNCLGWQDPQEIVELMSRIMYHASLDSIVPLAMHILNMSGLESSGVPFVPPDVVAFHENNGTGDGSVDEEDDPQQIPESLRFWMQLLLGQDPTAQQDDAPQQQQQPADTPSNNSTPNETAIQQLAELVATSIHYISTDFPDSAQAIIRYMVAQNNNANDTMMKPSTVQVLFLFLKKTGDNIQSDDGAPKRQSLLDYVACDLLLDNFHTNPNVRTYLGRANDDNVDLFVGCSFRLVVSRQIRLLLSLKDTALDNNNSPQQSSLLLLSLLTTSLWRSLRCGNEKTLVETVISSSTSASQATAIVTRVGEAWMHSLWDVDSSDDAKALGMVLSAVGSSMFQHPSSTVPLALLGALLGDGSKFDDDCGNLVGPNSSSTRKEVVWNAAMSMIQTAVSQLDSICRVVEPIGDASSCPTKGSEIFGRLAPLLLLRRAPPKLCHGAYLSTADDSHNQEEMNGLLKNLADHLAARLDITGASTTNGKESDGFVAEERQMAAEVAGRCLPFHEDKAGFSFGGASCFERICLPAFLGVLDFAKGDAALSENESKSRIRRARAALYAACHFVPFSSSLDIECVGEALVSTASFCLHILNADQDALESSNLEKDFLQLQTGCIEFFAICVE